MGFISIRKKLRGMKRWVRNLPFWTESYLNFDTKSLGENDRYHLKMWIEPFYKLYKINETNLSLKNPPHWFKKLILKELTEIYLSWKEQLEEQKKPYYLKLWLADAEFIDSRLVVGKGEQIEYHETLLKENPESKPFPKDKFKIDHPDFHRFQWKRYFNGYEIYENEIESEKELKRIKSTAYKVEEHMIDGKTENCYFISQGDMWVGQIPKSINS